MKQEEIFFSAVFAVDRRRRFTTIDFFSLSLSLQWSLDLRNLGFKVKILIKGIKNRDDEIGFYCNY